MKIAAFVQDRGACTNYRIAQPVYKIQSLGLADVYVIGNGDGNAQKEVLSSDIVFLGRAADEKALGLVRELKSFGKKVVFDLDDTMFDVSPFSPHYRHLGMMPVDFNDGKGKKIKGWQDGKDGFDVRWNRYVRKSFIGILREADCITVSTQPLKDVYGRFNDNVRIVRNSIDLKAWPKLEAERKDKQASVIYPAGSNHQEDWMFIRGVLEKVQGRVDGWNLILMGVDWAGQWGKLDPSRVQYVPWVDFEAYPWMMTLACPTVGIAPISEIAFNEGRSSIKWAEYAMAGAVTVATDFGPYRRDCENGKDAVLVKSREEWADALERMLRNPEERQRIVQNARAKVKSRFNLDFVVDEWMNVFKGLA